MTDQGQNQAKCREDAEGDRKMMARVTGIAEKIVNSCGRARDFIHISQVPGPVEGSAAKLIDLFRQILFPGYFSTETPDADSLRNSLVHRVTELFDLLCKEISSYMRHDCLRYGKPCFDCHKKSQEAAVVLLEAIPEIRALLATDVAATFDGDPAAKSHDEIIFSYPGIYATAVYRVAHKLFELDVPLLPRILNEYAHHRTGIDIHPGAVIGPRFVIDHGTGVVIGETTRIGRNVRIYQGVTLGALNLPQNAGEQYRGEKRHPDIEDDVIIYAGATILGGKTVIGARCVIGGSVWLTESVAPDTMVIMEKPQLVYKPAKNGLKKEEI